MVRALNVGNYTYGFPNATRTAPFLRGTGNHVEEVVTSTSTLSQIETVTAQIMETVVGSSVAHHEDASLAHAKSIVVATVTVTEDPISGPTETAILSANAFDGTVIGGGEATWSETTVTFTPTVTLTRTVTEDYPSVESNIEAAAAIESTTIVFGGTTTVHVTQDNTIYTTILPEPTEHSGEECDMAETVYITVTQTITPTASVVKTSSGIFESFGQEQEFSTMTSAMTDCSAETLAHTSTEVEVTVTVHPVQSTPGSPLSEDTQTSTQFSPVTEPVSSILPSDVVAITEYHTITHTEMVTRTILATVSGSIVEQETAEVALSKELVTVTRTLQRNTTVTLTGTSGHKVTPVPVFLTANGTAITTLLSTGTPGTMMPFANGTTTAPVLVSGGEKGAEPFRVGGGAYFCSAIVLAAAALLI
ncbi:hypothetical protein ACRALDRAFT_2061182 [Sodiomyces alcalophilus JCM 7366]|uniref:uncharacterized protein n=1 Tax=Sodiomyces alcalophilus JCM 7366 TaxID=591952 RepID=UPI0039B601CE